MKENLRGTLALSWLPIYLTTGGRLSLPPMQMGEAEVHSRPLGIWGVSSGLFPIWENQGLVCCLEIQSNALSGSQLSSGAQGMKG